MKVLLENRRSVLFLLLILLGLAACATQPASTGMNLPGFWMGVAHGFLMFFSMIGSFFTDIRIYAFPNAGTFYDLGYLLGAMLALGGTGVSVR